jgi:hypothetical protein
MFVVEEASGVFADKCMFAIPFSKSNQPLVGDTPVGIEFDVVISYIANPIGVFKVPMWPKNYSKSGFIS